MTPKKEKKHHENRIKILQEREKTKAKREEKRLQLKNKVLKDFEPIRIWKDKNTIEENLGKFRTKKEKLAALKSQINMAKEHVTITATNRNLKQFLENTYLMHGVTRHRKGKLFHSAMGSIRLIIFVS
jgi:hypothetical protein